MNDTIIGAIVGALSASLPYLVKEWLSNRNRIKLERVKLHDIQRLDAYKRLFTFARELTNNTYPLAEQKDEFFKSIMKSRFLGEIELDYIYFSKKIISLLDELNGNYVCSGDPDLIDEYKPNEIFDIAQKLEKTIVKEIKS